MRCDVLTAEKNQRQLYIVLAAFQFVSALPCLRNYVVVADTPATRFFVIAYDTVIKKTFFRNHFVLLAFSVLGFVRNEFFSLLLLDIINNNVMLQNIFKAFVIPIKQLSLIFYMLLVSSLIYAHFGLAYYEESFENADGSGGCHSGVSCWWLIVYKSALNSKKVATWLGATQIVETDP